MWGAGGRVVGKRGKKEGEVSGTFAFDEYRSMFFVLLFGHPQLLKGA